MIDQSLARSAHRSTGIEKIATKAEAALDRLRSDRPALASRIDKAEAIIVQQLSISNGYRPIRVRVHPDGDYTYLVASGSKLSRRYEVNPHIWSCDCPDHRRRGTGCKHAIATWVLELVFKRPARPKLSTCDGCGATVPRRDLIELHEENHDALTWFDGDQLCQGCARASGVDW